MTNVNRPRRAARLTRKTTLKSRGPKSDFEALQILKASGVLNHNVTLDQVMRLAEKLNIEVEASGSFIFRDFIYRPC